MAQETRATIENEIQTQFPDNNQKQITAADLRAFQLIMSDSKFNLLDDNIGELIATTSFGNILLSTFMEKSFLNNIPLFYVDIVLDADDGSARDRYTLTSFSSNNPTVNVTGSEINGIDNQITITYSEYYGSSEVRAFSPSASGSSDARGLLVSKRTVGVDINYIATFQNINGTCSFEINDLFGNVNQFVTDPLNIPVYVLGNSGYRLIGDIPNLTIRVYFWDGLVANNNTVADLVQ